MDTEVTKNVKLSIPTANALFAWRSENTLYRLIVTMSLPICSERGWKGVQKVQKVQREEA